MITAAAEVQRRLWGTDPQAWAELAEAHNRPLFEAVLDAAGAGPGTRLLDVGCGTGLTLVLAADRGAVPSGADISPGLLAIARKAQGEVEHHLIEPVVDLVESLGVADPMTLDQLQVEVVYGGVGDGRGFHRSLRLPSVQPY